MAFTAEQFLQSLLQNITTYYTATYSSDTDLYQLLLMYSEELASGSAALETIRNNLFIVACENSMLYSNFGTYFQQAKYFEQNYDEDRYTSGSGTYTLTTPTQYTTETSTVFKDWTFVSHDSAITNFPYTTPADGTGIVETATINGKLYGTCFVYDNRQQYQRLVEYNPITNSWSAIQCTPILPGDLNGDGLLTHADLDFLNAYLFDGGPAPQYLEQLDINGDGVNGDIGDFSYLSGYLNFNRSAPVFTWNITYGGVPFIPMGLLAHRPYLRNGEYASYDSLFYFDIVALGSGNELTPYLYVGEYSGSGIHAVKNLDQFTPVGGTVAQTFTVNDDLLRSGSGGISYTNSVAFHDKIYMGFSTISTDTVFAPDNIYKYPFILYFDPQTKSAGEIGLATQVYSDISTTKHWTVYATVIHKNKIWLTIRGVNSTAPLDPIQQMISYDGINIVVTLTSAADTDAETVRDMISYSDELYAIVWNTAANMYYVKKYADIAGTWSIHTTYTHPLHKFFIYENVLLMGANKGYIYYLDTSSDTWEVHYQIVDVGHRGITQFEGASNSPLTLYGMLDNGWYTSEFSEDTTTAYIHTGAGVSGSAIQRIAIPSYRKQLDFMIEAAVNGSTLHGVTRVVDAFTLINPDIRELYDLPQWRLKTFSGSMAQLSTNVWEFSGESWRTNLWAGAHTTFVSGSAPTDKATAGYVVIVNDNNTVTVGPIYNDNLLFDFRRP